GATGPAPKVAVVNLDDPYGAQLLAKIPENIRTVTFGENPAATVRADQVALNFKNSTFKLVWPKSAVGASLADARASSSAPAEENSLLVDSPLIGRYNVSNLLAAVATAWALVRDPSDFLARLR